MSDGNQDERIQGGCLVFCVQCMVNTANQPRLNTEHKKTNTLYSGTGVQHEHFGAGFIAAFRFHHVRACG